MPEERQNQEDITLSKVKLGDWQLGQYFKIIAWPVVLAEAFSVVYVLMNKFFDFIWVVNVLAFAFISHLIIQKHKGAYKQAVVANLLAGLIMGFVFALFKLIWLKSFYLFFNLIVEPVITALIGLAVAVVFAYVYSILPNKKSDSIINSIKSSFSQVGLGQDMKGGKKMPEKQNKNNKDNDIEENKLVAAIGYVWILCLIPLFLKKDSKFAQFHGKQALVLFIVEIVGMLVFWIPVLGWILAILVIVLAVLGIVQAWQGKYWEMPIIGQWAKKINL